MGYDRIDIAAGYEQRKAMERVAPGIEVTPVIVIDGITHVGFDRDRIAQRLGLPPATADDGPHGTMSVREQITREVRAEADALEHDLELARRVHRSLMPPDMEHADCEVAVRFRARIGVGGDYATIRRAPDGRYYFAVSDVTGHGIASALLVARVNSYVLGRLAAGPAPHELVTGLNNFLCTAFDGLGLFLTFFVARFDPLAGTLEWSGAAHPPAFVLRPDGTRTECASDVPLLGIGYDVVRGAVTHTAPLAAGDTLVLYTDGCLEARSPGGLEFGANRLCEALRQGLPRGAAAAAESALAAVARHEPGAASDDRLILVARIR